MNPESAPHTLLQLRNLVLKLGRIPTPSALQLLMDTVWGTPGGMRYQHFDTAEKVHHLHDPWFMYLEKDDETMGVLCLDHRKIGPLDSFYIRYFSFAEAVRRKGVSENAGETPASRGQGLFKRFSSSFFDAPTQLFEIAGTPKAIFYAYVELENARSRDMVKQMGLTECGKFSTMVFSRIFLKRQPQVRRYRPDERATLRALVAETYRNHAFYTDHGLFYKDNFFVLEVDGQVVAGLQAHAVHWKVVEIPDTSGRVMMQVLPWMPLISRLFNPREFRFAALEGIFCLPGHEGRLQALLEGVLAEMRLHTALIWMSPESPMGQLLRDNLSWGMLQRFKKDTPATVVMRSYGYSEADLLEISARPVYVCAFDST